MAAEDVSFRYDFPPELTGGVYANVLSVWHSAHEFTLDFFATHPAQPEDPDDDESEDT